MRALVVDDDRALCHALALALLGLGVESESVSSAEEALGVFTKQPDRFGLIITDLRLPKEDGIAFMERIRRFDPQIPLVVITGHPSTESAVQALRMRAVDFLKKPFATADLERMLTLCQQQRIPPPPIAPSVPTAPIWRQQLVRVLTLAVRCWRTGTGRKPIDLARESGLWSATLDHNTWRARTLEKYLRLSSLPTRPTPKRCWTLHALC